MNKGIIIAIVLIILASVFCGCIGNKKATSEEPNEKLFVYSGAGLRESMDQIAEEFELEHGIKVEITYGGAAQLLSQIELAGEGDVFIPGGRPIFNKAKEKGFIEHEHFVAYHIPVIGVPKGNPENITCLKDLARPDVEIALGDAKAVPIGKAANKILEKAGISDDVNVVTRTGTEPELVRIVVTGGADAAIFWKSSLLEAEDKIDIIEIPKEENDIEIIPIGVLTFSDDKDAAKDFVHFVTSERGKAIWERNGYITYPNEEYGLVEKKDKNPGELSVYCGAGMRESMDIIGKNFEDKYGIRVWYNYGGSPFLLGQIELSGEGDVFMPGDRQVTFNRAKEKGFIKSEHLVAYHIPVIAVPKGNPEKITCLKDLARDDIEVALCDPTAASIGKVAERILGNAGIKDDVNVVTMASCEPKLIIYLSTGSADAAIIWRSSLAEARDKIDIIEIPEEQNDIKIIPIGVLTFSDKKEAAQKFCDFVVSEESKKIWEQNGYVMYPNEKYGIVE